MSRQHDGLKRPTRNQELEWFYVDADGDMGRKAIPLEPGIGSGDQRDGPTDREVEAATRYRRIADAVHALSHADQRALRLAHVQIPPGFRPSVSHLGELALVVLDLAEPDEARRLVEKKGIRSTAVADAKARADRVVRDAIGRFAAEYECVKRAVTSARAMRTRELLRVLRGGYE